MPATRAEGSGQNAVSAKERKRAQKKKIFLWLYSLVLTYIHLCQPQSCRAELQQAMGSFGCGLQSDFARARRFQRIRRRQRRWRTRRRKDATTQRGSGFCRRPCLPVPPRAISKNRRASATHPTLPRFCGNATEMAIFLARFSWSVVPMQTPSSQPDA